MKNTTNVFLKGMTSDMHPLTTSQLEYTDALNATLITFNGNEQMMLNDMGNTRIQDSKTGNIMGLREGFVPVGVKEHGGIIYIASVNKEGKGELGTIPSPVITYKSLDDVSSSINFDWVENNDESDIFNLYDEKINPEEIFVIDMEEPKNIVDGKQKDVISSLTTKRLYVPHLIAITSKGEKDITPTKQISGSDSWFNTSISSIDLESINNPLESQDSVNFLSYPKILPGKLGIKFTKENIKEFRLAPNGKYPYSDGNTPKCYPVLLYDEKNGIRNFYSTLYGVCYTTDSDVKVDKIEISYTIDGITTKLNPLIVGQDGFRESDGTNIEYSPDGGYYLTKLKKNFHLKLKWPASDSTYPTYYIRAPLPQFSEIQLPLYKIDLGTDYNKWIDLEIKYYRNGWNNPLGIYTMTYNPYYMDSLGLFITKRYWKIHQFKNGKYDFPQYRRYSDLGSSLPQSKVTIGSKDATIGELELIASESQLKLTYSQVEFKDDSGNQTIPMIDELTSLTPSNKWIINVSGLEEYKFPKKTLTTYLRQEPALDPNGLLEISSIDISFPIKITDSTTHHDMTNTATKGDIIKGYGFLSINYALKIGNETISISQNFSPKVLDGPTYSKELFYRGTYKNGDEWKNIKVDFSSKLETSFTFNNDFYPTGSFDIELTIKNIETKNLLHFSEGVGNKHDLVLFVGTPTAKAKFTPADYNVLVGFKSGSRVYPQVDAVVQVLDENNNLKEIPAFVDGNSWNPILIDYKNNHIELSKGKIDSQKAPTGYTKHSVLDNDKYGSFNLEGDELYCTTAKISGLEKGKYYLYKNNDTTYTTTITNGQNSFSGRTCIIKPNSNTEFELSSTGFRSIGIYEIVREIAGLPNTNDVFIETVGKTIDSIDLEKCTAQSVYCYAEGNESYEDGIIENNELKYKLSYLLNPIPEHGYQVAIKVYEINTKQEYKDEFGNMVHIYDSAENEILFRNVDAFDEKYPFSLI